jgi:stage II sporulation protein D
LSHKPSHYQNPKNVPVFNFETSLQTAIFKESKTFHFPVIKSSLQNSEKLFVEAFRFVLKFAVMVNFKRLIFVVFAIALLNNSNIQANEFELFRLAYEPTIRIGLATNARSVSITTSDSSLVAVSPNEPSRFLGATGVVVTARAYRPPEIEIYRFEIPNIPTQGDAEQTAREARAATGEPALAFLDSKTNSWRVRIGDKKETIEEANEFKMLLSEKGFDSAEIVTEKIRQASQDAVALSQQVRTGGKSEVRSLIKPTGASNPSTDIVNPTVDTNLREVIVSGASQNAKFTSLKSVAFGSTNERNVPVRVDGKAYRGKIEVFVNSRGTLTVVNVVSLEDYMLGVVPNELSLPAIEAQKAQAVAARTYAVANINQFGSQGFDLLPTTRSQVYKGYSSESKMGTQAVMETRGLLATYKGKPINAMYTSTCGGRTENSENIFDFNEPYLRGVECSLEGRKHFEPFLIKTSRLPAKLRDEQNLELVRLMSLFAVNNFQLGTQQMTDDWFEDAPTQSEFVSWVNQLAARFGKGLPANISRDSAKPAEFAKILAAIIYGEGYAETLLSEADINYQLAFDDAAEVPPDKRASMAILLRDGWFSIYPDMTIKPNKAFSRAKMLRIINQFYTQKKWLPALQTGVAQASENGKLIIRAGKTNRQLPVRPDVFLFRQFGDNFYPVKETALIGGETVNFQTNHLGEVAYLEVKPATGAATADRMSSFSFWNVTLTPAALQSRLSRYVRGLGALYDVRVVNYGFSRRATELDIVASNGRFSLKGGKIRSALRLNEQLFVLNKRYDANGRATSYSFTGRAWGHGVGMCQYGAYGMAKMGLKYDEILKHYYTGIEVTKAY